MNRGAHSSVDTEICQYWYFSLERTHRSVYIVIISVYKGIFVCRLADYKQTHKQKGLAKMQEKKKNCAFNCSIFTCLGVKLLLHFSIVS